MTSYSRLRHNLTGLAASCLVLASCASPASAPATKRTTPKAKPAAVDVAGPSPSPVAPTPAEAGVIGKKAPEAEPARGYFGRVLGLDGKPAEKVLVVAHLLTNAGGELLSNHGGGLVSNHGGGVLSNQAGHLRLMSASILSAVTGPDGTFSLTLPQGVKANVEAKMNDSVKAILGEITSASAGFDLQLAPTGIIKGKVTVPADSGVTNLQGVDVYVPGTSYDARADADGAFRIDNVPVGTYKLWAEKPGLGQALSAAVTVASNGVASVGEFELTVLPIEVGAVDPAISMEGGTVTLTGTRFGKSKGGLFKLRLNGQEVEQVAVASDTQASFVVPAGARGPLVVEVDSIKSKSVAFHVARRWDVSGPADPLVLGTTQTFKATAYDAEGRPIKGKALIPTWQVTAGSAVRVDAKGEVTPLTPGEATLEASFQGWKASLPVQVVASTATDGPVLGGKAIRSLPELAQGTVDPDGTIFVTGEYRVLAVSATGEVSVLAGNASDQVADGQGAAATFEAPTGVTYDAVGKRLVVGDYNRIRHVTLPGGVVTTPAGPARYLDDAVEDKDGLGSAAGINGPDALALGTGGVLWFLNDGTLRKLESNGLVSTIRPENVMRALTAGPDGAVYGLTSQGVVAIQASGATSLVSPQLAGTQWPSRPTTVKAGGLARDAAGNFYLVTDRAVLRLDAATGQVSVLAGTVGSEPVKPHQDGPLASAGFQQLVSVAHDGPRQRLVLIEASAVRELDLAAGLVRTLAHAGGELRTINAVAPAGSDPDAADPDASETLE